MSGKNTKNNYKERERNEEKRTSAECVDKYLSLSDELCNNYLPPIKHGNVYFVFRTDILGLVVNNEILGVADLDTPEVYSVFGRITPEMYRPWADAFVNAMNIEFLPQEYFVEIEVPCKLL